MYIYTPVTLPKKVLGSIGIVTKAVLVIFYSI